MKKTMRRVVATVLIIVFALVLVACGGKDSGNTPASNSPAKNNTSGDAGGNSSGNSGGNNAGNNIEDNDEVYAEDNSGNISDDDVLEVYLGAMGVFIDGFGQLMNSLEELLGASDSISSEDALIEWCNYYMEIKNLVGEAADELADIALDVPEDYMESHMKVTFAVAAVYDAMTGFEYAVDAAFDGDEEAFLDGIAVFVGNIMAAGDLWMEAVEY